MSDRRYFSAETEPQAVLEAAGHFGVSPAELNYRPVNKKHGFLRRPRVVIEVDPGNPTRPPEPAPAVPTAGPVAARREGTPAGQTASPAKEQSEVAWVTPPALLRPEGPPAALVAAGAVIELSGLRLAPGHPEHRGEGKEAEIAVDLSGPDRATLVERDAEVLRACEYLVRRMVREQAAIVSLDTEGYRAERAETLRRRAAAAAAEVRRSGEPVLFEPLSAAERRVVHLAIQGEPGVASESEGEGERKRVRVALRDLQPGS